MTRTPRSSRSARHRPASPAPTTSASASRKRSSRTWTLTPSPRSAGSMMSERRCSGMYVPGYHAAPYSEVEHVLEIGDVGERLRCRHQHLVSCSHRKQGQEARAAFGIEFTEHVVK